MEPYSYSVLYLTGEIYENHGRNSDTEEAKGTVAIQILYGKYKPMLTFNYL
jgi:hypothetical protein